MKILIADDDPFSRRLLTQYLTAWGYEVVQAADGQDALQTMRGDTAPSIAIFDWIMPGLDGVEVCRQLRQTPPARPIYILILTSKVERADTIAALAAGADDFVSKPFDPLELRARTQNGARQVALQQALADRACELEDALSQVRQLTGILPICASCKAVRDVRQDQQYWQSIEEYCKQHSDLKFTHGICPKCLARETSM